MDPSYSLRSRDIRLWASWWRPTVRDRWGFAVKESTTNAHHHHRHNKPYCLPCKNRVLCVLTITHRASPWEPFTSVWLSLVAGLVMSVACGDVLVRVVVVNRCLCSFCSIQGLSLRQIRFRFDGQPINETDTPAQVSSKHANSRSCPWCRRRNRRTGPQRSDLQQKRTAHEMSKQKKIW